MDKKILGKYLLAGLILLLIGYGLGLVYVNSGLSAKSKNSQNLTTNVPGFDKEGKVIVYPTVNIISALIRENRVGQNLIIVEIASSTPNLAGTPLVRWVTVNSETVLNKAVQKTSGVELEKIKQVDLKSGDKITVDASPSNIRTAKEFVATSITLDLAALK